MVEKNFPTTLRIFRENPVNHVVVFLSDQYHRCPSRFKTLLSTGPGIKTTSRPAKFGGTNAVRRCSPGKLHLQIRGPAVQRANTGASARSWPSERTGLRRGSDSLRSLHNEGALHDGGGGGGGYSSRRKERK